RSAGHRRAGRLAGRQRAGGDAAHGRRCRNLEESFAGDLVHLLFLPFSLTCVCTYPARRISRPDAKTENPRHRKRAGFLLLLIKRITYFRYFVYVILRCFYTIPWPPDKTARPPCERPRRFVYR